jgi:hypothetical protein
LKKRLSDNEEETDRANKIYANLKALGVNVDAIKECCIDFDDLRDFYDRVVALLDKHRHNTPSVAL